MNKLKDNLLEDFEVIGLIVGCVIGIDILSLPSKIAMEVKQSAWISVIIGGIYPLFIGIILIYFCRSHPNEDILILSKKYFGKLIGNLLNILFMLGFVFYIVATVSFFTNIFRVYATDFLPPIKILIVTIFVIAYISYTNIQVIGRINEITFYLLFVLVLILTFAFAKGKYLNMFPILNNNFWELIKASTKSLYAYAGMETMFLIYPFIKNKNKISSIVFKGVVSIILTYTFVTFITIYYLGYRCTIKLLWPVIMVTESINLPFINSFRLMFLLLWSIIAFKLLMNQFFALIYILKNTLNFKNTKKLYIIVCPILMILSLPLTKNDIKIKDFLYNINLKIIIYDMFYIIIIFIMIFIESKKYKLKSK